MSDVFKLGMLQCDLYWESPDQNIQQLSQKIGSAPAADLWIIPEMYSTGFTMNPSGLALNESPDQIASIIRMCAAKNTHIAGSFIWRQDQTFTNRFILFSPEGIKEFYDKHHLFGFSNETQYYSSGNEKPLWEINDWKFAPFVCYDLRFPEWANNSNDADVMLFVANWPVTRIHHWRSLLIARAIENQCYVAGVNRTGKDGNNLEYSGDSICIDANGTVVMDLKNQPTMSVVELDREWLKRFRKKLPFLKDRF